MNALTPLQFSVAINTLTGVTGDETTDIVTKAAHGLTTGDVVVPIFASGWAGLTSTSRYYVSVINASTFYVCSTLANAIAGTQIDFTTAGGSSTWLVATPLIASAGVAVYRDKLAPDGGARVFSCLITPIAGSLGSITVGTLNSAGRGDPKSPSNSIAAFTANAGVDLDKLYFLGTDTTDGVDVLAIR